LKAQETALSLDSHLAMVTCW